MASGTWIRQAAARALAALWLLGSAAMGPAAVSSAVAPVIAPVLPQAAPTLPEAAAAPEPQAGWPALTDSPAGITHTLNLAGLGRLNIPNDPHLNPAGAI